PRVRLLPGPAASTRPERLRAPTPTPLSCLTASCGIQTAPLPLSTLSLGRILNPRALTPQASLREHTAPATTLRRSCARLTALSRFSRRKTQPLPYPWASTMRERSPASTLTRAASRTVSYDVPTVP